MGMFSASIVLACFADAFRALHDNEDVVAFVGGSRRVREPDEFLRAHSSIAYYIHVF